MSTKDTMCYSCSTDVHISNSFIILSLDSDSDFVIHFPKENSVRALSCDTLFLFRLLACWIDIRIYSTVSKSM